MIQHIPLPAVSLINKSTLCPPPYEPAGTSTKECLHFITRQHSLAVGIFCFVYKLYVEHSSYFWELKIVVVGWFFIREGIMPWNQAGCL
jgi:hypothetical protein